MSSFLLNYPKLANELLFYNMEGTEKVRVALRELNMLAGLSILFQVYFPDSNVPSAPAKGILG